MQKNNQVSDIQAYVSL